METLHYSILINADKKKVWDTMLNDATYRQWTEAFHAGSYFEGNWEQGSEMRFLAKNDKGQPEGMAARIKENRKYEFVSMEHYGFIAPDGQVDTTSEEVKKWTPALENYTFTEKDGQTELSIDVQTTAEMKDPFAEMWKKALKKLKELCEM